MYYTADAHGRQIADQLAMVGVASATVSKPGGQPTHATESIAADG